MHSRQRLVKTFLLANDVLLASNYFVGLFDIDCENQHIDLVSKSLQDSL